MVKEYRMGHCRSSETCDRTVFFVDNIVLWETVLLFGKGQQIPTGPLSSGLHSAERVSAGIDYP